MISDRSLLDCFSWHALADEFARSEPELWRICYPRIYPDAGHWFSARIPASDCTVAALKRRMGICGDGDLYEFLTASQLARFRMPTWFLSPAITEAIRLTDPPVAFEWHDRELPMEAGIFMLPKGALKHGTVGDCAYVAYARCKKGEYFQSPLLPHLGKCGSTNGGLVLMMSTHEGTNPTIYHYNFPYDVLPQIDLANLPEFMGRFVTESHSGLMSSAMTNDDHKLVQDAAHYVFGALLLMLHKPDLVTRGRATGKRTKHGAEFWTPNVIGANYRMKRTGPGLGGTHDSPRAHWRRGHWRGQPYGPKYSLRRDVWIEPIFVNADD